MKNVTTLLAALLWIAGAAPAAIGQDIVDERPNPSRTRVDLSGGAATFLHLEHATEEAKYPETEYRRETVQDKLLMYHIFWLNVNAHINDALSLTTRLSNTNATRLWRWTVEGEPQEDLAWIAFQYAYIGIRSPLARFEVGLLEVDRANEPLEVHFTPDRTAWTPYAIATRGSLKGVNLKRPLVGELVDSHLPPHLRTSKTLSVGLDFTLAVHAEGTGKTTVTSDDVDPPEEVTYNWPSLDFILRLPVYRGKFSLEPLVAFRSHADDALKCNPDDGKGDWRASYGFSGGYTFTPRFSARFGLGYSRFSNDHTRDAYIGSRVVGDQVVDVFNAVQDNASLYVTVRPQLLIGNNALVGDVKYSVFEDRSPDVAYDKHYLNASLLYFWRYQERLMLMPMLRVYSQTYENPNEHERVDFSRVRVCPQFLVAVTF